MKVEEYNRGYSLRFPGFRYARLCRDVSELPGVVFTRKRRFFWWSDSVGAEFAFNGQVFIIETDGWDGALWILAKDHLEHQREFQKIRHHFESRGAIVECTGGQKEEDFSGADMADCAECQETFNVQDMIAHSGVYVCASCKPRFLQKLAEGVTAPKSLPKFRVNFWLLLAIVAAIAIALAFLIPPLPSHHHPH